MQTTELRELLLCGEVLPDATRARIVALGAEAVPALIEILQDERLSLESAPGRGYAPIHAAKLLGQLGDARAIGPLLKTLRATHWETMLHNQVLLALPKHGAPVLEPGWELLARTDNPEARSSLLSVLADLGTGDPRVTAALVAAIDGETGLVASNLAAHGDPAAIPALARTLDGIDLDADKSPLAQQDVIELAEAIRKLGGTLSEAQQKKLARVDALRAAAHERRRAAAEQRQQAAPAARPGRNDACWCGSGKKYKKCHLAADDARQGGLPTRG